MKECCVKSLDEAAWAIDAYAERTKILSDKISDFVATPDRFDAVARTFEAAARIVRDYALSLEVGNPDITSMYIQDAPDSAEWTCDHCEFTLCTGDSPTDNYYLYCPGCRRRIIASVAK